MALRQRDLLPRPSAASPEDGETRLIERAVEGDLAAFEELCRSYFPRVRYLCRKLMGGANADDGTQEVFLRAFVNLPRFHVGSPLWPWLATIARNVGVDESRRKHREHPFPADDVEQFIGRGASTEGAGDTVIGREEVRALRRSLDAALARLTERERDFVLRRLEGQSYGRIATAHHATASAVKNAVFRARRSLRPNLEEARRRWRLPLVAALAVRGARRIRDRFKAVAGDIQRSVAGLAPAGDSIFGSLAIAVIFFVAGMTGDLGPSPAANPAPAVRPGRPATTAAYAAPREPARAGLRTHLLPAPGGRSHLDGSVGPTQPNHVAPDSSRLRVWVTGPDGEEVYWFETEYECNHQGSAVTPEGSPVQAVC